MPKRFDDPQEKKTYQSWADMRNRCNNENHARYHQYGGRGIKVCERWNSFDTFKEDMGLKPDGLTLDRIDNNGNYEPNNCEWATYRRQNKHKTTTTYYECDGESHTIEEWADIVGIPRSTLSERIHRYKWDIEKALTAPLQHKENIPDDPEKRKFMPKLDQKTADEIRKLHAEEGLSLREIGRRYGISGTSVSRVIHNEVWTGGRR